MADNAMNLLLAGGAGLIAYQSIRNGDLFGNGGNGPCGGKKCASGFRLNTTTCRCEAVQPSGTGGNGGNDTDDVDFDFDIPKDSGDSGSNDGNGGGIAFDDFLDRIQNPQTGKKLKNFKEKACNRENFDALSIAMQEGRVTPSEFSQWARRKCRQTASGSFVPRV